jgi:hypothetical protein
MATRARIGIQSSDGQITAAYQHWDGYPGGLGYNLCDNWTNLDKVLKAIKLGNASTWGIVIGEKTDFDDRKNEMHDVQNIYYGRDRGEKDQGPNTYATEQEYLAEGWGSGEEYLYLLKDTGHKDPYGVSQGEWYYATRVWSDSKKDYDPSVGFQPLQEAAIRDKIRMLQFSLKQSEDSRKKVA